ncbi:MAG: ABC transporter permease subunit [Armatimonadetes bacterium]|nr:ABC transporter permease subunit [Armatimonadota bacterium]
MIRILRIERRKLVRQKSLLADIALLFIVLGTLYAIARVGAGMMVAFNPPNTMPAIDLNPANLPYYAARSTLRMFLGLGISLAFTLSYGYIAAKNHKLERIMIPLLDILQSVPVFGYLAVTVTAFIALFPGSLLGLECAAIFAIFTGQAWNMTFAFYHSLITLPKELDEATRLFRLNKFQRFAKLEVPAAMIPLVWNAMMSFGGGWFFVSASEAISVLKKGYSLPGLGSYVAKAVDQKNLMAVGYAVITIVLVIVIVDQLFWRPLVAWAEKFKLEKSASAVVPSSWLYDILKSSSLPKMAAQLLERQAAWLRRVLPKPRTNRPIQFKKQRPNWGDTIYGLVIGVVLCIAAITGYRFITSEVSLREVLTCLGLGGLTFLRVVLLVALSTLIWTPIGVAIGFQPKLARFMQPLVLLFASFPANFLFPLAAILFLRIHLTLNIGSMFLMALGTQWYILFNVIAGAMQVPTDLREMAINMRLSRQIMWKRLIIPAIFPAWVTGAITASGGAWNASVVSEVITWGNDKLEANGLGSYITRATQSEDWPRIVLGVAMMCIFVVTVNRLVWRRLYTVAESRYKLA